MCLEVYINEALAIIRTFCLNPFNFLYLLVIVLYIFFTMIICIVDDEIVLSTFISKEHLFWLIFALLLVLAFKTGRIEKVDKG